MGLKGNLLTVPLEARFGYDAERNIFFLNLEGLSVHTPAQPEAITAGPSATGCHPDRRVNRCIRRNPGPTCGPSAPPRPSASSAVAQRTRHV